MDKIYLKNYNTFGLNVVADSLINISSEDHLLDVLKENSHKPTLILGGGSNILFTKNVKTLILKNEIKGLNIFHENDDKTVTIRVGGGEVWHEIVLHCIGRSWGGIENLSLIPGTVGAAPIQNIGAYGVELKEVFYALDAINLETFEKKTFYKDECEFGYRESVFKKELKGKYFITHVYLTLQKQPILKTHYGDIQAELAKLPYTNYTIRDVSNAVIAIRSSKLPNPAEIGNAGSFFKNPSIPTAQFEELKMRYPEMPAYPLDAQKVKIPAAWLIQQQGWKGKRFGNFGVHEKQALVLVNYGGANGQDILELSEKIIDSVKSNFGIELEREVNIL
ncbi:MAG: UDP-N-acetylmuramate dehydrogenase [Bacteroidia bacterium]